MCEIVVCVENWNNKHGMTEVAAVVSFVIILLEYSHKYSTVDFGMVKVKVMKLGEVLSAGMVDGPSSLNIIVSVLEW